jgi:hypothetical protein
VGEKVNFSFGLRPRRYRLLVMLASSQYGSLAMTPYTYTYPLSTIRSSSSDPKTYPLPKAKPQKKNLERFGQDMASFHSSGHDLVYILSFRTFWIILMTISTPCGHFQHEGIFSSVLPLRNRLSQSNHPISRFCSVRVGGIL